MRLIDADALKAEWYKLNDRADAINFIKKLMDRDCAPCDFTEHDKIAVICYQTAIKALSALPSAEAVQGEWIKKQVFNPELDKYVPFIECSVCGYEPYYGGSESKFNYCANCGARMKGGTE